MTVLQCKRYWQTLSTEKRCANTASSLTSQLHISKIQALAVPAGLQAEWMCYSANDAGRLSAPKSVVPIQLQLWHRRFRRFNSQLYQWNCKQDEGVTEQTMLADSQHLILLCQYKIKFDEFQTSSSSCACRIASRMRMLQCKRYWQILRRPHSNVRL